MTQKTMTERLQQRFQGAHVEVTDLTGTADHYEVRIHAQELLGLQRMAQHKAIMTVFDQELKSGEIHALTIRVLPQGGNDEPRR